MRVAAFFDFCGTLVPFQTADRFVDFVRRRSGSASARALESARNAACRARLFAALDRVVPSAVAHKRFKLLQLRGVPREALDSWAKSYYEEEIRPFLSPLLLRLLREHRSRGDITAVVSGGYDCYLEYFAREHGVNHVLATGLAYDRRGRCLGVFDGKDCMGAAKTHRIVARFSGADVSLADSTAYSDSESDLPMLTLVGRGVAVVRDGTPGWALQRGLETMHV